MAPDVPPAGRDVVELRLVPAVSDGPAPNRLVVYDWFTRLGAPPRPGNRVEILVDGEETWARTADDLRTATREAHVTTWVCRPDIELERPVELALSEPADREGRRLADHVEAIARRGGMVRLLVWGLTRTPILDRWLRHWHWRGGTHIGVLEQDHRLLIGSHHQKTLTIDGRVGYCGGMNLKENDWDTPAHLVFEPRRMPHLAGAAERRKVALKRKRPKFPPRHDFSVRIEGPAIVDLEANFRARWNTSVHVRRRGVVGRLAEWYRRRTGQVPLVAMPPPPPAPPPAGDVLLQVVRTTPEGERGILDVYRRALRSARRYVYIENQYFRSALLAAEVARALERNPQLRVVVVVPAIEGRVRALLDPFAYWTGRMQEAVRRVRPAFYLSQLVVSDVGADGRRVWQPVDVHAKVMIVDDFWLTMGSANLNDRSFRYESEMNVVIQDRALAGALRRRLMAEHLELAPTDARLEDVDVAFDLWDQHAGHNTACREGDRAPLSRVHSFLQPWDGGPPGLAQPPLGIGARLV